MEEENLTMHFLRKLFLDIIYLLIVIVLLPSCKYSSDVLSEGFLTKRKYNKGWYANRKNHSTKRTDVSETCHTMPETSSGLSDESLADLPNEKEIYADVNGLVVQTANKKIIFETMTMNRTNKININQQIGFRKVNKSVLEIPSVPDEKLKEGKENLLAILAVLLFIWPTIAYPLMILLSPFNSADALIEALFLSTYLSILIGIIIAIIAYNKVKKNPCIYKNVTWHSPGIKISVWSTFVLWAFTFFLAFNLLVEIYYILNILLIVILFISAISILLLLYAIKRKEKTNIQE